MDKLVARVEIRVTFFMGFDFRNANAFEDIVELLYGWGGVSMCLVHLPLLLQEHKDNKIKIGMIKLCLKSSQANRSLNMDLVSHGLWLFNHWFCFLFR